MGSVSKCAVNHSSAGGVHGALLRLLLLFSGVKRGDTGQLPATIRQEASLSSPHRSAF